MEQEQGFFYIIPAELAEQGEGTKALLYGVISSFNKFSKGKRVGCKAGNAFLAKKLSKKDKSIIRKYLTELEENGWIAIENRGGKNREIFINVGPNVRKKPHLGAEKTAGQRAEKTALSNINTSNISGNEIDKENLLKKALPILEIQELSDSQIKTLIKLMEKYPSRDYEFQALKCKEWWDRERGGFGSKPLLAFSNWLERSKVDEAILKQKRDREESMKFSEREKDSAPKNPETLRKVQELRNNLAKKFNWKR